MSTPGERYLALMHAKEERKAFEAKLADPFQSESLALDRDMNRSDRKRLAMRVQQPELDQWLLDSRLHFTLSFVGYLPAEGVTRAQGGRPYRNFTTRYELIVRRDATYHDRQVVTPEVIAIFPFQQGMAYGAKPAVSGIMANVAADARLAGEYSNAGDFVDDMFAGDAAEGLRAYAQMHTLAADLRRLVTREQYGALIEIVNEHF
jgi:hypothetical protein